VRSVVGVWSCLVLFRRQSSWLRLSMIINIFYYILIISEYYNIIWSSRILASTPGYAIHYNTI
jgi:hypothetical protein